jgi:hypothetical protein
MPPSVPPPALLVLAAGMSSRYGGKSKQTDAMGPGGETLLDFSVFDARAAGFGRVVFIIRREGEAEFRERVVNRLTPHLPVSLVYQDMTDLPPGFSVPAERRKPWGTGHAVWAARHEMTEPFCVINADDFYGAESFAAMARFLRSPGPADGPAAWSMVGFRLRNTLSEHGRVARGLCSVDAAGLLAGVEELTDIHRTETGAENRTEGSAPRPLSGDETVSMNMWGFTPAVFGIFGAEFTRFLAASGTSPAAEFYIPLGVDAAIRSGSATCRVLPTESQWFGVTWPDDRPRVVAAIAALFASGQYRSPLWT